jgi:hypothetical protein
MIERGREVREGREVRGMYVLHHCFDTSSREGERLERVERLEGDNTENNTISPRPSF